MITFPSCVHKRTLQKFVDFIGDDDEFAEKSLQFHFGDSILIFVPEIPVAVATIIFNRSRSFR